ncbi:MAG: hypothetical protein IJR00_10565 [Lachnospiraceae bacterium]|nr:hypothetical protein [Lachnospiraceae bacterium]
MRFGSASALRFREEGWAAVRALLSEGRDKNYLETYRILRDQGAGS